MELKRVLFNKKIIITYILLVAISVGFFLNAQYNSVGESGAELSQVSYAYKNTLADLKGKSVSEIQKELDSSLEYTSAILNLMSYENIKAQNYEEYKEIWLDEEIRLRNEFPQIAEEYDNNKNSIDRAKLVSENEALTELKNQLNYISGYPYYLKGIDEEAVQMSIISIFSEENSLSKLNIEKTVEDYSVLKSVELEIGNDKPLTSVLEFDLAHYLMLFFVIVLVLAFLEERRKGLWNVVYSTPKGRLTLALRRSGILIFAIAAANIIMYGTLFLTAFLLYGGTDDLFRNVQSIELFQNFIFPMSEISFILFYVLINILLQLTLSFLVWFVLSGVQNITLASGALGIIFAAEFALFAFLPSQSNLAVLKYMNLFSYINPTQTILKYNNVNAFVIVINQFWLVIFSSILFTAIFAFLCICVSAFKYPEKTSGRLETAIIKAVGKITTLYRKAVEKLTVTGTELYKLLIINKGIVVLALLLLVMLSMTTTDKIYYSGADGIMNTFYREYGGEVTEKSEQYVRNLETEISDVESEYEKACKDYAEKTITDEEFEKSVLKNDAFDSKREALKRLNEKFDYIQTQKSEGNDVWLVNPNGYEKLIGESGFSRRQNFTLLSIFCIIIISANVFAFEKRSGMYKSLMASYRGRGYLFSKKLVAVSLVSLLIWLCFMSVELYDVFSQFSLDNLDAPMKSLEFFSNAPFNISLGGFVVIMYLSRLIMMLAVTYIVCLASVSSRYELGAVLSAVILLVPSALYAVGIEIFAYASVSIPVAFTELYNTLDGYTFLIPLVLLTALGVVSIVIAKRKWCREGGRKYAA